jgi:hypothetical protein
MNEVVKEHLHYIALGAEIVSRRARALPYRPPFPTAAVDELADAEAALEDVLQKVREAMRTYDAKAIE